MKRLEASDIKDMNLLKHYRIIRKWACKNNGLNDADRERNRTTQKYNIYKVSFKAKQLIKRMYRIMLGEEDIPISERRNKIMKGKTYIDKVLQTSIMNVNKDKYR
jgi:hypothetical protein